MATATDQQKADALLHATALERAYHAMKENAGRRTDIDGGVMETLAVAAMILSGEYRRIVSTGELDA